MEQNISLVQARALEQVDIDSAADDDYSDMQDVEDVSYATQINNYLLVTVFILIKQKFILFSHSFIFSCGLKKFKLFFRT